MHPIQHFKTITQHRQLVRYYCFRIGLYRQGLMHDLSKYSPVEFVRGAICYQGNRSPNNKEREVKGVSMSWLHHKGRNKHHFEYWIDYTLDENGKVGFGGNRMPKKYVAEMFCDRVAASRIYRGDAYTDADPYDYYIKGKQFGSTGRMIHPETAAELEEMLRLLKFEGEDAAIEHIRKWLKEK